MGRMWKTAMAAGTLVLAAGCADPAQPSVEPTADQPSVVAAAPAITPEPYVDGDVFRDAANGDVVWVPKGANWPSFEYSCVGTQQHNGWLVGITDEAATAMQEWDMNAVRIPLNQDCWLGTDGLPSLAWNDPAQAVPGVTPTAGDSAFYRKRVQESVETLNRHHIVAILDLHWSAPEGVAAAGQKQMADEQSLLFWESMGSFWQDNPSVIFDLYNEPILAGKDIITAWREWRNGGYEAPLDDTDSETFTTVGMQALLDALRSTPARQPVLVAGPSWAATLQFMDFYMPRDPLEQIAVSWHPYPSLEERTDEQYARDLAAMEDYRAAVVARLLPKYPVVMTELSDTWNQPSWLEFMLSWADEHGVGYLPWAWWRPGQPDADELRRAAGYMRLIEPDDPGYVPHDPEGATLLRHLQAAR